jgi:transposase-like protein
MPDSVVEVIVGRQRRRWGADGKVRIVPEAEEPCAILRAVAARHDVYPNLLGTW